MSTGAKPPPGPFTQEIAGILRAKRAWAEIGQKSLAAAVGISQSQLSSILKGTKHVDVEQLDALCWALGLRLIEDVLEPADRALALRHTSPEWKPIRLVD